MFNLSSVIYTFYVNEFINATLMKEKDTKFLKSHEKFRVDFFPMRERFNTIFSTVLHDYIIFTSACELVESAKFCDYTIEKFLGHNIMFCYDNDRFIEDNFHKLYIPSFITICEAIFCESYWKDKYFGGEKWWTGIKYIRDIYPKDKVAFIDSVIDIQHNTNILFSKRNPWFEPCTRAIGGFLDKRKSMIEENILIAFLLSMGIGSKRSRELNCLYRRFLYLYMPNLPNMDAIQRNYIPILASSWQTSNWNEFWATQPVEYTGEYREYDIVDADSYQYDEYYI